MDFHSSFFLLFIFFSFFWLCVFHHAICHCIVVFTHLVLSFFCIAQHTSSQSLPQQCQNDLQTSPVIQRCLGSFRWRSGKRWYCGLRRKCGRPIIWSWNNWCHGWSIWSDKNSSVFDLWSIVAFVAFDRVWDSGYRFLLVKGKVQTQSYGNGSQSYHWNRKPCGSSLGLTAIHTIQESSQRSLGQHCVWTGLSGTTVKVSLLSRTLTRRRAWRIPASRVHCRHALVTLNPLVSNLFLALLLITWWRLLLKRGWIQSKTGSVRFSRYRVQASLFSGHRLIFGSNPEFKVQIWPENKVPRHPHVTQFCSIVVVEKCWSCRALEPALRIITLNHYAKTMK